jgi:hypothetical protein
MNWRVKLLRFQKLSIAEQTANKEEILACFQSMWFSKPSMEDFAKYTRGLVLMPEMIYMLVKK